MLIGDPRLLETMSLNAQRWANDTFDMSSYSTNLLAILTEGIASRGAARLETSVRAQAG
jgi:hypothetical protein